MEFVSSLGKKSFFIEILLKKFFDYLLENGKLNKLPLL